MNKAELQAELDALDVSYAPKDTIPQLEKKLKKAQKDLKKDDKMSGEADDQSDKADEPKAALPLYEPSTGKIVVKERVVEINGREYYERTYTNGTKNLIRTDMDKPASTEKPDL